MKTPFGPVTLQCPAGTLYPARYDSINGLWRPIDGTTGEWVSECPCSGCAALRGAGWPDPHAQRVVDHPPLNTPLSAFTPAMLDALPVGSRFGESSTTGGIVEKRANGWHLVSGGECVDFPDRYNGDRPLIRVGPEQASEPALTPCGQVPREVDGQCPKHGDRCPSADPGPLPDPWPGMVVEVQADSADEWDRGAIRRAYRARHGTMYVHVEGLESPVQWHSDEIREVRAPDGTTLWKRPAAKVTAEPRPLSTYTEEERRAFPVGTKIGIYTKQADAFPPVGEVWCAADGMTLMGGYVADAMARSGDMLVHFPAKVTT